jgi:hypothetical protein
MEKAEDIVTVGASQRYPTQQSQIYFTLPGMTQGVAIYFLAYNFYLVFFKPFEIDPFKPYELLQYIVYGINTLTCLTYLILITFEYVIFYAEFWSKVKVGLVDVIVTVILGFVEILPMFALDKTRLWCAFIIPLRGIGILAYGRSVYNINYNVENNAYYSDNYSDNLKTKISGIF